LNNYTVDNVARRALAS